MNPENIENRNYREDRRFATVGAVLLLLFVVTLTAHLVNPTEAQARKRLCHFCPEPAPCGCTNALSFVLVPTPAGTFKMQPGTPPMPPCEFNGSTNWGHCVLAPVAGVWRLSILFVPSMVEEIRYSTNECVLGLYTNEIDAAIEVTF